MMTVGMCLSFESPRSLAAVTAVRLKFVDAGALAKVVGARLLVMVLREGKAVVEVVRAARGAAAVPGYPGRRP